MTDTSQNADNSKPADRRKPTQIVRLGRGEAMLEWPGGAADVGEARPTDFPSALVYGERKAGAQSNARHLMTMHLKAGGAVVTVAVDPVHSSVLGIQRARLESESEGDKVIEERDQALEDAFRRMLQSVTDNALYEALRAFVACVYPPVVVRDASATLLVVVFNLDALRPAYAGFWGMFRGELEVEGSPLRLLGFLRQARQMWDEHFDSLLTDATRHFRIAPWSREVIEEVAKTALQRSLGPADLQLLRARTGGQPKLVELCLQRLADTTVTVESVTEELLYSPPPAEQQWRKTLLATFAARQDLIGVFREYVQGRRRPMTGPDRPPHRELALYATGWVGPDEPEDPKTPTSWGIRSWLHQGWAYSLLRELPGGQR